MQLWNMLELINGQCWNHTDWLLVHEIIFFSQIIKYNCLKIITNEKQSCPKNIWRYKAWIVSALHFVLEVSQIFAPLFSLRFFFCPVIVSPYDYICKSKDPVSCSHLGKLSSPQWAPIVILITCETVTVNVCEKHLEAENSGTDF